MVINYRKGPVGTHIPLQTEFPASVPYRLAMSNDAFSSLVLRITGLVKQFPHSVQMQRDSSLYLYVESFKKSHSDPKDHYIQLNAENYQAALTQDWLRQYQQHLSKPEFSNDRTDHFIILQLFVFIEDCTPPVMKHINTYLQPHVKIAAPQAPVPRARATAPTSSSNHFPPATNTGKSRSSIATGVPQAREGVFAGTTYQPSQTQHVRQYLVTHPGAPTLTTAPQQTPPSAGSSSPSAVAYAGAFLDYAIGQRIIPDLGELARSYMLTQVMLQPSMSLTDLSVLAGNPSVKILIASDQVMAARERRGGMSQRGRGQQL
ncbi:hypothetical protein BG006_001894 [Podila minutissima]|uniref:Uncharacterized protein n=1 Tax=Podila minutissima TaxID=64525 RepID=A0A9P5SSZ6_9FUNG|nr:hypothetical protein BG006_001894 [Podila minutissima]